MKYKDISLKDVPFAIIFSPANMHYIVKLVRYSCINWITSKLNNCLGLYVNIYWSGLAFAIEQTTYENFRYRYDKKENPYNKGILDNLRETFFSKIPPSLIDFRALVQECENVGTELRNPNLEGSHSSLKDKIDTEMGIKLAEMSGFSLPEILRNLDYNDVEDNHNVRSREGNGRLDSDPFFLNIDIEEVPIDLIQSSNAEDEAHGKTSKRSSIIQNEVHQI